MKKLRVCLGLGALVLASMLVLATAALAEATLLAEWLIKGLPVTTSTSTLSTQETMVFAETNFGEVIECSGRFEGTVGNDGVGTITKVTNTSGTEKSLVSPLTVAAGECKNVSGCSTTAATEFAPEELPWSTLLALDEITGKFLDVIIRFSYAITCTILGIKTTDTCSLEKGTYEVLAAVEGAEAKGGVEPSGNCSVGGKDEVEWVGANHLQNLAKEAVIPSSGA